MKRIARVAGCLLLLTFSVAAFGHAQLDHASPAVGSQSDAPPTQVKIWFDADVDPAGTSIQVLDASGKQVDAKDSKQDAKDKTLMAVSLPARLPDGTYKVVWKALCMQGHKTNGDFTFVVKSKQ